MTLKVLRIFFPFPQGPEKIRTVILLIALSLQRQWLQVNEKLTLLLAVLPAEYFFFFKLNYGTV